ncbi:MAG: hypothetical protein AB8B86_08335 [Pseudomonadales bacterium]
MSFTKRLVTLIAVLVLTSCVSSAYRLQDVAKSDASLVYELHYEQTMGLLRELTIKLYKRNPRQLPGHIAVNERLHSLFEVPDFLEYKECGTDIETQLMERVLAVSFQQDRVFCLMAGLVGMIKHSFNYKSEFFLLDSLDEQKLYKSARNIERLMWRLAQNMPQTGKPLLLTNSLQSEAVNLSFERLFGKLIGQQDVLAQIVAGKNKRAINYVARKIGSFFFLPL